MFYRKYSASNLFFLFLIFWGVINLLQALFTPLISDESYYWMYSQNPDWGYFDHPPMISLLIKAGYSIFRNELGVRLLVVFCQLLTLLVIWQLTDEEARQRKENVLLLIMIISIMPIINIYGFVAAPDSPLLLFTAVFVLIYKKFTEQDNWKNTLLLSMVMAAIMYSKYHGALVIILVILSNIKLLKNPKFYIAGIFAVVLFLPHIYWQYSNGFPSVKYHLAERVTAFNITNVPEYFLNLLLILNPLIFPVCVYLMIKSKIKNTVERASYFVFIGFILFFFVASFRYHIEPQWMAAAAIPMIIIVFNNIDNKSKIAAYIKWVTVFLLPLIFFTRIALAADFLPIKFLKKQYHETRKWAKEIEQIAGDNPVVFTNSYQNASKYTFYTKKFAHSLNNLNYRKNQYDLWNFEEQIHGKDVLYIPHFLSDYYKEKLTKYTLSYGDSIFFRPYHDFQSLQRECIILDKELYFFSKRDMCTIKLTLFNPYPYQINLRHIEFPVVFQVAFINKGILMYNKRIDLPEDIKVLNISDTLIFNCSFTVEDIPAGRYKLAVYSETGILYPTYNSGFKEVIISE